MKLYIGVTDDNWFEFLAQEEREEVNFWSPSGSTFKVLQPNELFLFKLHAPRNYIVGGGFFVKNTKLPLSLAWDAFGTNNGAPNLAICRIRVQKYRKIPEADPIIGCNILASPFFFAPQDWIAVPESFKLNIVQGKGYETSEPEGALLVSQVMQRLQQPKITNASLDIQPGLIAESARYGNPYLTQPRLGQGAFRVLVTEAYERQCAFTGEHTLPVLDAAHIKPYAQQGPHAISNGLLMRADLHILFDRGYVTVRPDYTIDVSPHLKADYNNGRVYYALQNKTLESLPQNLIDRPSPEFLAWHNQQVFRI